MGEQRAIFLHASSAKSGLVYMYNSWAGGDLRDPERMVFLVERAEVPVPVPHVTLLYLGGKAHARVAAENGTQPLGSRVAGIPAQGSRGLREV